MNAPQTAHMPAARSRRACSMRQCWRPGCGRWRLLCCHRHLILLLILFRDLHMPVLPEYALHAATRAQHASGTLSQLAAHISGTCMCQLRSAYVFNGVLRKARHASTLVFRSLQSTETCMCQLCLHPSAQCCCKRQKMQFILSHLSMNTILHCMTSALMMKAIVSHTKGA